jgi:hypothetical protein
MKNKTTTLSKLVAITGVGLALMNCSSQQYDPIRASDSSTLGYSASERWAFVAEHQATKGSGADTHDKGYDYLPRQTGSGSEYVEVRPLVTTQDSFTISANSLGVKLQALDKTHIGMNLYFNLMQINADIDVAVPAYLAVAPTSAHVKLSDVKFSHKFELYVPLSERVRITSAILLAGDVFSEGQSLTTLGVGLDYLLSEKVTLGLGYKKWFYESAGEKASGERLSDKTLIFTSGSDVDLSSSGVSGELTYRF